MKKRILFLITMLFMLAYPLSASADTNISVVVNGTSLEMEVAPIIENGRTLIPLRAIGEALGAEVNWFPDTQEMNLIKGNVVNVLQIGSKTAIRIDMEFSTSDETILDVAPQIYNGRTLVPLRYIAESFGVEVSFDSNTQTVYVGDKPNETTVIKTEENFDNNGAGSKTYKKPITQEDIDKEKAIQDFKEEYSKPPENYETQYIPYDQLNDYFNK